MRNSERKLNKALDYLKNLKLGDAVYNSKIQRLYLQIFESKNLILEIERFADAYSFDQNTPENGFFSVIDIFLIAMSRALKACDKPSGIWRLFMTKNRQIRNLQTHTEILDNFIKMFRTLIEINAKSSGSKSLINDTGNYDNLITKTYNDINIASFYGQNIGFHHTSPTRFQSRFLTIAIASFAEFYYSNRNIFVRLLGIPLSFLKFTIWPEECGRRSEQLIRNSDVDFFSFGMQAFTMKISCFIQNFLSHRLQVNKMIKISPEPIQIESTKFNGKIEIPIPSSHINVRPIPCHLLSAKARDGMVGERSKNEPSKYLIIHTHGGGFYTHTTESHEVYLREWAVKLDVPILSIEYSLAPNAPFPRALEEIFYVYCWALKSGKLLGTTAEKILLVGDSAGANLNTAMMIKCIENGVKVPQCMLSIYGLFLSNYSAIPSMMMGYMDVFLTYAHLMRIFKTYAGHFKIQKRTGKMPIALKTEFSDVIPKNHLMSPIFASKEILSQFPSVVLLTTVLDPCMDENIEMAKKLRAAGVNIKLTVLHDLVHGFLHLVRICKRSSAGSATCVKHMKELLAIE
ncbi:hypothetical protein PVAND_004584 [Polypedilum vanderplanki]|uniref:Hormone-sensitive lipase n=1 Tax=Polypedilum vanderplanki TaxID=319348 RepID=A0A9J6BZJ3_POLVA|nr:hypothetical protein PVAND_004584 [Polypedilum vanderplanki]